MAINQLTDWQTNPDNNTDLNGIGLAENVTTLASVNNLFRAMMAQLATAIGGGVATIADLFAGTANNKFVSPKGVYDAAAYVALTDAATITLDLATGINFTVTLSGNRTLAFPTNPRVGQTGYIRVRQDATGSRALAYAAGYDFGSAGAPILSTTANKFDLLFYFVDTTSKVLLFPAKGFG